MENEFLKTKSDIEAWLQEHKVCVYNRLHVYTLVEDPVYGYAVNVQGSVVLDKDDSSKELSFIPVKFGRVSGNFSCVGNHLTSLEFAPSWVGGRFDCSENWLASLKYSPAFVGSNFDCSQNQLTSLEFGPTCVEGSFNCSSNFLVSLQFSPAEVNGDFYCVNNKLTSLKFGPKEVRGTFDCANNKLTSLEFCPRTVGSDFGCYDNKLSSLEFCPESVGGYFFGGKNRGLGKYQNVNGFETILACHKETLIKKGKENIETLLSKIFNLKNPKNIIKI